MNAMVREERMIWTRAHALAGMAGKDGVRLDGDDLSQKAFERFYEAGLDRRVDPARGSALALLYAVLSLVFLESLRAEAREQRRRRRAARECLVIDPRAEVLERELLSWLRERMGDGSPGTRTITERECLGLLRTVGSLFGRRGEGAPDSNDRIAACRAKKKLRAEAQRRGLLDG